MIYYQRNPTKISLFLLFRYHEFLLAFHETLQFAFHQLKSFIHFSYAGNVN